MTSEQKKNKRRQEWRHFTRKYWKELAAYLGTEGPYSIENINRMKMGKAPRRLALVRHKKTGLTVEMHLPVELHHVFGMNCDTPQEDQTVIELFPHEHDAADPSRHFNFEFVEWRGFI